MESSYVTPEVGEHEFNTVALLIVKNEEMTIRRCIDGLCGKFDEVLIVDTGSTDSTIDIIKKQAISNLKIVHFPWTESFSEARNYALNLSKGKYVFFIDADEVLLSEREQLKKSFIEIKPKHGNILKVICPKIIDHDDNYTTGVPRAFLNKEDLYYFGHVHEELRSGFSTLNFIVDDKIVIEHHGYSKDIVKYKGKVERNIYLLEKTIREEPLNPRWIYFLYRDGYDLFDAKGAIKSIRKTLNLLDKERSGAYKVGLIDLLVRYQLKSLCSDRKFEKTVNLLDSIEPNNTNSAFYRALFKLVKWKAKAKEVLDELIEYRETHQTDMAEMLHSEGFHLDSMIAIYLMECGYYKQAKKLFDFLLSKNYENDFINHYLSLLNGKKDT